MAKKPRDGERCLREIQSILMENDISPFEVPFQLLSLLDAVARLSTQSLDDKDFS